jgi:hypothetical protein
MAYHPGGPQLFNPQLYSRQFTAVSLQPTALHTANLRIKWPICQEEEHLLQ